ncbi:hypothetical protein LAZ67_5000374 [Cordylochernes scorpioides]|uniref:C2H2-type domain-containing protein n=1 Tax=Cordylochernes scorpioides TaxID=51811 RepID=A0ABY6KGQ4_9ARAC|nr:hypothetical protein LAZ67_5000374 [Cordylochernes scorpioides]
MESEKKNEQEVEIEHNAASNIKDSLNMNTSQYEYKCENCPFHENNDLKISTKLQCSECNFSTNHYSSLIRHKRIHTGTKKYECKECTYKAHQKSDVGKHRLIHERAKKYKCDSCEYGTTNKGFLKKHQQIHKGKNKPVPKSKVPKVNSDKHSESEKLENPFNEEHNSMNTEQNVPRNINDEKEETAILPDMECCDNNNLEQ